MRRPLFDGSMLLVFISLLTVARAETIPLGPLPQSIGPTRYRLELKLLPDEPRFSGRAEISVVLKEPTTRVWLHGKDLNVTQVSVLDARGRKQKATYRQVDPSGVAEVAFSRKLPAGAATLVFLYDAAFHTGGFNDLAAMRSGGLMYVSSIMFSNNARQIFPSFDEPRFKTPYEVSLIVPAAHVAMTNAPEVSSEAMDDGLKRVKFAPSKPIPTYLVGFTVGPWDVAQGPNLQASAVRTPVRGFAVKGKGEQLRYVLDNTPGVVSALESYLGTPYPYEKLDLIAIPDPQERGGMENAAAISYGEYNLLADEKSSVLHKRDMMDLHAHELAHQWFGDLVTPTWWDHFWINESFANFLAQRTMIQWAPGRDFERVGRRRGLEAMTVDSSRGAFEIRPTIETIAGMSDGLNQLMYAKGSAVLDMFEHYTGPEAFRSGVRAYLQKFAYGNASTEDFLAAFATGVTPAVSAALRTFLIQPGVPQLDIEWACSADALELKVSQSRYVSLASKLETQQQWQVPLCVAFGQGEHRQKHCELLSARQSTVHLPVKSCPTTVMPNADGAGYYRFTMAPEKLRALSLETPTLSASEALSLEDSLAAAMRAGRLDARDYLQAVPLFVAHPAWDVAAAPIPRLRFMVRSLLSGKDRERAQQFARELYSPLMKRLGVSGTSEFDRTRPDEAAQLRRVLAPFLALDAGDSALRTELAALARAYATSGSATAGDPSILGIALMVAAQIDGDSFAKSLWARARSTDDERFRENALSAIARLTTPSGAEWVRSLVLSPDLKPGESATLLNQHAAVPENLSSAWAWEKAHLPELASRIKSWRQQELVSLTGGFCDAASRKDVESTFRSTQVDVKSGVKVLDAALDRIDHCIAMSARHGESIRKAL